MYKLIPAALLFTFAMAGTARDAQASDRKYFPASICQPAYGSSGDIDYTNIGEVRNNSTTARRTLSCPLVHDDTTSDDYSVDISVWDGHSTQAVECFAKSITLGSPSLVSSSSVASAGTGRQTLSIDLFTSTSSAYFQVSCDMPPQGTSGRSYVTSIDYVEY